MYTTVIDEEDFAVKPMNCPGACLIYRSKPRSYRDLPLKLAEAGLDHRHELRGALHGLFRVRSFTQDDAHLFIRPDQITDLVTETAHLITTYYQQFGFPYHVELSTRPENSMGSDEDWERAEAGLKEALESMGVEYILNEGDGAFYGPKIDLQIKDALGREWQCGTIQLDFQLPRNFDLKYTAQDGSEKVPVVIHRAIFGSIERFLGIIIENFKGVFPFWMSPYQVAVVPIRTEHNEYAKKVVQRLKALRIRVEADYSDNNMKQKIKKFKNYKDPYILVLGDKEAENGTVSINMRGSNKQINDVPLDKFIDMCLKLNMEHSIELIDTVE
jgi:threonyl-tRNA synthetase